MNSSAVDCDVRLFAGAAASAGTRQIGLHLASGATLNDLKDALRKSIQDSEFDQVLARCTFLVNSIAVTDTVTALPQSGRIDVLPPFAGG